MTAHGCGSGVVERWAALPDEAFTLRAPLVAATARRPDEGCGRPGSGRRRAPQAANGEASRGRQTRQGR